MKPTQTAKKTAQNIAKKVAQENLEFLKSARNHVAPTPETTPAQISPNQPTQEVQADDQLKAKVNADSKRQLDKLEEELKQIRTERQQQISQSRQEPLIAPTAQKSPENPNPPGKARRAIGGMIKRLTGKREMQKNVSG